jgi:RimJ/RimL family protein N-acetyltransferase
MIVIETKRLLIRKITQTDLDDLYGICSDSELMKFVGDGNPLSKQQTQKWIDVTLSNYASKGFGMYGVIDKETGAFIGYCGLVFSTDVNDYELIYGTRVGYRSSKTPGRIRLFCLGYEPYLCLYRSRE